MAESELVSGTVMEPGGRVAIDAGRELTNEMTGTVPTSAEIKIKGADRGANKDYNRGDEIFFVARAVCRKVGIQDKPNRSDPDEIDATIRQHEFEVIRFDLVDAAVGLQLIWEARHPDEAEAEGGITSVTITAERAKELRDAIHAEDRGDVHIEDDEPETEPQSEQLDGTAASSNGHASREEAEEAAIAARAAEIEQGSDAAKAKPKRGRGKTKAQNAIEKASTETEPASDLPIDPEDEAALAEAAAMADANPDLSDVNLDDDDDDGWGDD